MSIILDALRKVEQEKRLQKQPRIDIKQRLLTDRKAAVMGGLSPMATRMVLLGGMMVAAMGILYGSYAWLNQAAPQLAAEPAPAKSVSAAPVAAQKQPEPPAAMAAVSAPVEEPVVDLTGAGKTAIAMPTETRAPTGRGMEKERRQAKRKGMGRKQADERAVPWYADDEVEVSAPAPAPPVRREMANVTAGTEPPARRTPEQAAPAPSVTLDGIIYHTEPDKRSALLRLRGQDSMLLKIGDKLGPYTVAAIEQSKVELFGGEKTVELKLE